MARRGPIPKPNSKRSLQGAYRRIPAPVANASIVPPPSLMQRPLALNCWTKHAATLIKDGRLTAQSVDNFVMMCHYQADAADHEAKIAAEGTVIVTTKGMVAHPSTMLLERARRSFLRMSQEFGLTPASYARLPLGKPNAEAVNEEEALLRRFTG